MNRLIYILFFIPLFSLAQLQNYSFEAVADLQQKAPKNTMVFIHTAWCQYCNAMKKTTLRNKKVIEKLNKNYYFIDFNAETKTEIVFNGKVYKYHPRGRNIGTHELAEYFQEQVKEDAYPLILILNPENQIVFHYSGFIRSQDLLKHF